MKARSLLLETLAAAIADISEHGYDSQSRVDHWLRLIREAALKSLTPEHELQELLRRTLIGAYQRLVEQGQVARFHPGVNRFTIDRLRPHLRAELDRRILASAALIKLDRQAAIERTLRRFQGWSTSIPRGGSDVVSKRITKEDLRKALGRLPFEERRVIIDQSHKLRSSISEIIANEGGAIAAIWHSHWRQAGYDFREDHKDRDDEVYMVRGNWAAEKGLIKVGPAGYTDEITKPGEEVYCRCWYQWIYNLRDLPAEMLTTKGRQALAEARKQTA